MGLLSTPAQFSSDVGMRELSLTCVMSMKFEYMSEGKIWLSERPLSLQG